MFSFWLRAVSALNQNRVSFYVLFVPTAVKPDQRIFGSMSDNHEGAGYIELSADIVSAYVSNNSVPSSDLPTLIRDVYTALRHLTAAPAAIPVPEELKPAISVKKSVTNDYIICLEDGRKFKSLKRHLRTQYNMSPEDYREKWGLPADYPMVAPSYAQARSNLARQMGLGQQRKRG
jgi:predicted transcriptional regulator